MQMREARGASIRPVGVADTQPQPQPPPSRKSRKQQEEVRSRFYSVPPLGARGPIADRRNWKGNLIKRYAPVNDKRRR